MILRLCIMLTIIYSTAVSSNAIDNIRMFTENYPPFNMKQKGKVTGISVDILDIILKKLNAKITTKDIRVVPWANGYKRALKQKNTMIFVTTRTKHREKLFKWVGPIIDTQISIIALKNKHYKIDNIKQLNNYKIGAVIDDIGEQLLLENGINKENIKSIGGTNPIRANLKKMLRNRIDMFAYEISVAMYGAKSYGIDSNKFQSIFTLKKAQ